MLTLGTTIMVITMATMFVLTCLFMILVILIQKPKGGGLSGAFGGAGGSAQAAFGAKTGDLLTTITIACFILFLGLAIGLTYAIRADVAPRVATPETSAPAATIPGDLPNEATDVLEQEVTATDNAISDPDNPVSPPAEPKQPVSEPLLD